jgi:hypothetical protein
VKRENRKALTSKRIADRKATIANLEVCIEKLHGEATAKDKRIAELDSLLSAARAAAQS